MTSDCTQAPADSSVLCCMRDVIWMYAVCILSGCGPSFGHESADEQWSDDPRSASIIAQEIYEIEHGPLRQQCVEDAELAEFVPMDPGALGVQCGFERNGVVACFYKYDLHGPRFAILTTYADNKQTQVHEFMHYMLSCGAADSHASDPMHDGAVWLHFDDAAEQMHQTAERRE